MILDKTVEILGNNKNLKRYKELGYKIICGEKINIRIEDLICGSHAKIKVKCDICEKEKTIQYNKYIKNTKKFTLPYCCSRLCGNFKFKKTKLEKYGDENYVNSIKAKKTKLEKYSNQNYNNRKLSERACEERYGVKHVSQNKEVKEKVKKTNLKRYGVENTLQGGVLREKYIKTMIERYGSEKYRNPKKIKEYQNKKTKEEMLCMIEKCKKTKLEKYGDENYNNKKSMKKTNIERYNKEYASQNEDIKRKVKDTVLKKFGVENVMQNDIFFEKQQKNAKKLRLHEKTGLYYRGSYEAHFLDYCFENNIKVEKPKSIKYEFEDKKRTYHPDFFLREKKLIIEIKSTYTYNKDLEKNIAKQDACVQQGFNFIFIINKDYSNFK
jgi:very-short-patch-repair endonuclease